tara:strand:- start:767 stop:1792 length:1026 start_codon:yes stop_codon:yes gene_type:complete
MNTKSAIIISPLPLLPVKSGMQNTINLLCRFLKEKKYKIFFFEIKTNNKIDPILNLEIKKNLIKKIKTKVNNLRNLKFVFVNTSKILFNLKFFLDEKYDFKTMLVCHDLYYFRKKYFDKIKIRDNTKLSIKDEINILKKVDHIIDFSQNEFNFLLKKKILKKKFIKTLTPTVKFKKINIFKKKKYDLLYVSSNWLQNHLSIKNFLKEVDINQSKFKILILGNLPIKRKNIDKKSYSIKMFNECKIGIAIMKNPTGRQTKIFEMLSAGLPVFTNVDLSEFGLKDNKHYKFFDKKKSLVEQLNHLIQDKTLQKKISKNAYNWSKKNTFYKKAFQSINQILIRV